MSGDRPLTRRELRDRERARIEAEEAASAAPAASAPSEPPAPSKSPAPSELPTPSDSRAASDQPAPASEAPSASRAAARRASATAQASDASSSIDPVEWRLNTNDMSSVRDQLDARLAQDANPRTANGGVPEAPAPTPTPTAPQERQATRRSRRERRMSDRPSDQPSARTSTPSVGTSVRPNEQQAPAHPAVTSTGAGRPSPAARAGTLGAAPQGTGVEFGPADDGPLSGERVWAPSPPAANRGVSRTAERAGLHPADSTSAATASHASAGQDATSEPGLGAAFVTTHAGSAPEGVSPSGDAHGWPGNASGPNHVPGTVPDADARALDAASFNAASFNEAPINETSYGAEPADGWYADDARASEASGGDGAHESVNSSDDYFERLALASAGDAPTGMIVMPEVMNPEITGALSRSGDVMVTGSMRVSRDLSAYGVYREGLDQTEDEAAVVTDGARGDHAPISAKDAISSQRATGVRMAPSPERGLNTWIWVVVGAIGVAVVGGGGVLLFGLISGWF